MLQVIAIPGSFSVARTQVAWALLCRSEHLPLADTPGLPGSKCSG